MTGQQLKNSILQMAVQGKLVPQDPNDEPASVLLERIRKEKEQLIKEGKKDKALAALDYAEKMIPSYNVPYDWANGAFQMAEAYYQLGQNEKANKIIDELANKSLEYMIWYLSLTDYQLSIASENFMYNAGLLDAEVRLMEKYKSEELAKHYSEQLDQLYNEYVTRMKGK